VRMILVGLLLSTLTMSSPDVVPLRVAAVQFRSSFNLQDNLKRIIATLERLADAGVNVAAFPECALTGYHTDAEMKVDGSEVLKAEGEVQRICKRRRIAVVLGSIYKVNGRTFDTAVVIDSQGQLVERYGKLMLAGEKWATPGNHVAFFELEGVPSTVIICHDERYPELVRLPALMGAKVVYYISHEAGMQKESKLAGYRAQMMARAVENGVVVVASNAPANVQDNSGSHGQSRIIKDDGNILQEASFYGDEVLIETLQVKVKKEKSENLEKTQKGLLEDWWRVGTGRLMRDRGRQLE